MKLKLSGKTITIPMQNEKVEYKKNIRNAVAKLGKELDDVLFYNDKCNNRKTSRRIKFSVGVKLSEFELGTLCGELGNAFGCRVDIKNYEYLNSPFLVAYLRRKS
jgi:hypothetical protein